MDATETERKVCTVILGLFEHLPNRHGISGRAERMYLDAQFSKPIGSSYFHR